MTTLGQLVDRAKGILNDVPLDIDSPAWLRSEVVRQLDQEITTLSRRGIWGNIMIVQAEINRALYPMNEQGLFLATGRDNSGTTGNLTTLTDTTQDFVVAGVAVDDRLRNLTDGSQGIITTVAATVLTCSAGLTGGVENVVDTTDLYLVERPVTSVAVVDIACVLYNGQELFYATEDTLDRLPGGGWEVTATPPTTPKYWTVNHTFNPTVLRIVPPPITTGSSIPVIPGVPLPIPWQNNLVVFFHEQPQQSLDESISLQTLDAFEDLVVYETVAALAMEEGDYQDEAVATIARELGSLWRKQLLGS